ILSTGCIFMDSEDDGSGSRWFFQKCKRPITKTGYTSCECVCKTWVNDGTNEKWLVLDSPLASPPLNNKGPILLSDEGEFEEDYEVVGRKRRMVELAESENHNKGQTNVMMRSRVRRGQIEECKCS
ncbi:hypothetical protein EJD97_001559, partial [Solanum chilense]